MAGGFTGGGEGDVSNVDVGARMVVLGEDALADEAGVVGGTFGKENDDLAKFLIRAFGDEEGGREVRTELTLELLGLDLQASGANGVVATTEDAEEWRVESGEFGNIVGGKGFGADLGSIDDEGVLIGKRDGNRGEGCVPIGGIRTG